MIIVTDINTKNKLIANGEKFICEQIHGNKTSYLFEDLKNIKLESEIEFFKTQKMIL